MKKVTSFTHLITGEGDRLAYTYSVITEDGNLVEQNTRGNVIVLDPKIKQAINTIQSFIESKLGGE